MLNPLHLHTLQVVLRTGTLADAGRELGYTGSAVSQQIMALERHLGFPLLERGPQGVIPNATAQFIAEQSAEVLGRLRSLEDDIMLNFHGELGLLRIGSFATAAEIVLPLALQEFRLRRPGVELQLREGYLHDLVPLMQAKELDMALTYRYLNTHAKVPREFSSLPLFTEKMYIVSSTDHPTLGGEPRRSLVGLEDEKWISTGMHSSETVMLRQFSARAGFRPFIGFHMQNFRSYQALIQAGMGIALIPATGYIPMPHVRATLLDAPEALREVFLLRPPSTSEGLWGSVVEVMVNASKTLSEQREDIDLPSNAPARTPHETRQTP